MTGYQIAKVISNATLGENVKHLTLSLDPAIPYQPGQFFLHRLRSSSGDYVERSYSAANYSDGNLIEFVIRIEPQGQMSTIIATLKSGDLLDIKGPFGRFGEIPAKAKKLVLIAGGVGISPIRSMVQKYAVQSIDSSNGDQRRSPARPSTDSVGMTNSLQIQLFYGFRTWKDFLFETELKSCPIDLISQAGGYITESLEGKLFPSHVDTHGFICGPPPMVKATREKLFALGYDRKNVHVEAW